MITDRESRLLTTQSSSSRLGAVAAVAGAVLVAGALVRLAEKFEDIHRMTAAAHESRVTEEIRHLREPST